MRSVQRKLWDASLLAALFRISNSDVEYVSIYDFDRITFRLTNSAFARLYSANKVPKKSLGFQPLPGEIDFYFDLKGARFRTFVKLEDAASWQSTLEASTRKRIESTPRRLGIKPKQARLTYAEAKS